MRRNTRKTLDEFPIPEILEAVNTLQELEAISNTGNKKLIKEKIYKGEKIVDGKKVQKVRELLCDIYYKKCAYCEDIEASPDVEHYRPKKRVTEESTHPGYYWLCYEWTNLLPSCRFCNTGSGKLNQFPILGIRVSLPAFTNGTLDRTKCKASLSPLIDEKPFLLHPEIDSPDDGSFFQFSKIGKMSGIDADGRAKKSIEICDLNRDTLLYRRQKLMNEILLPIKWLLRSYLLDLPNPGEKFHDFLNLIFEEFNERTKSDRQFSLFVTYLYDNFEELMMPQFDTEKQGSIINEAFKKFNSIS